MTDQQNGANVLTTAFSDPIQQPVILYDMTLREGEQPPGVVFTPEEKLEIAQALDAFGVHWLGVGFPAVSESELKTATALCRSRLRAKTAALCRLIPAEIDLTVDTGVDYTALFFPGSDIHLQSKLRTTESDALKLIETGVRRCRDRGGRVKFTIEDGSRTPLQRILRMSQVAIDAGAEYIVIADTVGILTPTVTRRLFKVLRTLLPRPLGVHFHNDLGLALGNSVSALEAGVELVEVTINGVGERSGNTCLEELAVVLLVKYGRDLGLKLGNIPKLSSLVNKASRGTIGDHKPVTGKWCFTHEAGVHVAGILANPETYQAFAPALVGREHEIAFGKHSGTQSVLHLAQSAGMLLGPRELNAVLERIKQKAETTKSSIPKELVLEWIREAAAHENGTGPDPLLGSRLL